jgi:gamma-butyrobetaine dioxygenase
VAVSDEALTEVVRHIGLVRLTFYDDYFDVRSHIEPWNLAYTAAALELHTDTPAEEMAPGIKFLYCRANSVAGGDNLFLHEVAEKTAQGWEPYRGMSDAHFSYPKSTLDA